MAECGRGQGPGRMGTGRRSSRRQDERTITKEYGSEDSKLFLGSVSLAQASSLTPARVEWTISQHHCSLLAENYK